MSSFREVPRPVIALGTDYPDGHVIAPHRHHRDQLLYGMTGVLMASTPEGAWMMPPQRGMLIPAGVIHDVRLFGDVKMRSLYLRPERLGTVDNQCRVVGISSLMRQLLIEAVEIPPEYDLTGRDGALMTLIEHEIKQLPVLPLSLPLPEHQALRAKCHAFLASPTPHETIDDWCSDLGMSRRTFTRQFRKETGSSFVEWRQQACILAALPKLAAGDAVTTIAMDLGYDNPAAFSSMFKRILGTTPRDYRTEDS